MEANRNKTLWCGNLDENVTEEILYELFLQVNKMLYFYNYIP